MSNNQIWITLIGSIVPLGGYVVNRYAPWAAEQVKAIVQVALAAVAAGLYTALSTSVLGWNAATLELVGTGVVSALLAHKILWQPAKINVKLGATEVDASVTATPRNPTGDENPVLS